MCLCPGLPSQSSTGSVNVTGRSPGGWRRLPLPQSRRLPKPGRARAPSISAAEPASPSVAGRFAPQLVPTAGVFAAGFAARAGDRLRPPSTGSLDFRRRVLAMAMASPPRRNDGTRRPAPSGMVLRNDNNTHEVEVAKALNQWAVTVTALADNRLICQDFFARRWEAVARAEDFVRLLRSEEHT